jgi:hypothetical protein
MFIHGGRVHLADLVGRRQRLGNLGPFALDDFKPREGSAVHAKGNQAIAVRTVWESTICSIRTIRPPRTMKECATRASMNLPVAL